MIVKVLKVSGKMTIKNWKTSVPVIQTIISDSSRSTIILRDYVIIKIIRDSRNIHNEVELQKKAHLLGLAPEIISWTPDSITMSYIRGQTLDKVQGTKVIRAKLITAINKLYSSGIIHGNLISKNVLVTDSDEIMIIDYRLGTMVDGPYSGIRDYSILRNKTWT